MEVKHTEITTFSHTSGAWSAALLTDHAIRSTLGLEGNLCARPFGDRLAFRRLDHDVLPRDFRIANNHPLLSADLHVVQC